MLGSRVVSNFATPKWHKYSYSFCFTLLYFNGNNLHLYYMIIKKKNLLLTLNLVECLSKIYEIFWWYKLSSFFFSLFSSILFFYVLLYCTFYGLLDIFEPISNELIEWGKTYFGLQILLFHLSFKKLAS